MSVVGMSIMLDTGPLCWDFRVVIWSPREVTSRLKDVSWGLGEVIRGSERSFGGSGQ